LTSLANLLGSLQVCQFDYEVIRIGKQLLLLKEEIAKAMLNVH
jgi:hypothetical protein